MICVDGFRLSLGGWQAECCWLLPKETVLIPSNFVAMWLSEISFRDRQKAVTRMPSFK